MNSVSIGKLHLRLRAPGSAATGAIVYAIGHCDLGDLLVGRSRDDEGDGISVIFIGDTPTELRAQLVQAFPRHSLAEAPQSLAGDVAQVASVIDHPHGAGALTLSVAGTAFQQKVWQALCQIPAGATVSYTGLARSLAMPQAVRAVASACAANVLAVAIPCHRVLRSDGSISGYRWGVQRKRDLLLRERQP